MRILGEKDREMSDKEFLGFVRLMTKEMIEIAQERGMDEIVSGLRAANLASYRINGPRAVRPRLMSQSGN